MEVLPRDLRVRFPQFVQWDATILDSFEKAGDISMSVLHNKTDSDKGSKTTLTASATLWSNEPDMASVGPFVEIAIQRTPLHYIRNGYYIYVCCVRSQYCIRCKLC